MSLDIKYTLAFMEMERRDQKFLSEVRTTINNIIVSAVTLSKQSKEARDKVKELINGFWLDHVDQMAELRAELAEIDRKTLEKYGITQDTLPIYIREVEQNPLSFEQAKAKIIGDVK